MKTIDSQIVLLPKWAREERPGWLSEESYRMNRNYSNPRAANIHAQTSVEAILLEMDAAEVEKAVVFGYTFNHRERCLKVNEHTAEVVAKYPGRFLGLAVAHLNSPANVLNSDLEYCLGPLGLKGVKIKPQWQGYSLSDKTKMEPLLAALRQQAKPRLFTHVSQAYDVPMGDSLAEFLSFVQKNRDIYVVGAHLGGLLPFYYSYSKVRDMLSDRVYINTSLGTAAQLMAGIKSVFPISRILFGTDFPFYSIGEMKSMLAPLFTAEEQEQVFFKNSQELFWED